MEQKDEEDEFSKALMGQTQDILMLKKPDNSRRRKTIMKSAIPKEKDDTLPYDISL